MSHIFKNLAKTTARSKSILAFYTLNENILFIKCVFWNESTFEENNVTGVLDPPEGQNLGMGPSNIILIG